MYSGPMGWLQRLQKKSGEGMLESGSAVENLGPVCEVKLGVKSPSITMAAYL